VPPGQPVDLSDHPPAALRRTLTLLQISHTSGRPKERRDAPAAAAVDSVESWGTAWRTKVSCGQAAVYCSALLHVCRAAPYDANTPMATSAGELREARGAGARVTSGASRAARSKKRRYEVRRRNGHRKVARTLADRILVLTKAVQGNLDGFVAFGWIRVAANLAIARAVACGMRDLLRNAVDSAIFLWMRVPEVLRDRKMRGYDACTSTSRRPRAARSSPVRVASRKAPAPRRRHRRDDIRRPPGRTFGEDKRRSIPAHHEAAQLTPDGFVALPIVLERRQGR
jgi:hypothetical protein